MKYAFMVMSSLVLLSCNYERTTILPAAPTPPVTYLVSGTVRDSAGRPIENAYVTYEVTVKAGPLWRTDAAGRFQLRLRTGAYNFRISGPTAAFRSLVVPVHVDGDTTVDFMLLAAGP